MANGFATIKHGFLSICMCFSDFLTISPFSNVKAVVCQRNFPNLSSPSSNTCPSIESSFQSNPILKIHLHLHLRPSPVLSPSHLASRLLNDPGCLLLSSTTFNTASLLATGTSKLDPDRTSQLLSMGSRMLTSKMVSPRKMLRVPGSCILVGILVG